MVKRISSQILLVIGLVLALLFSIIFIHNQAYARKDTLIVGVPVSAPGADPDVSTGPEEFRIMMDLYESGIRWPLIPSTASGGKGVRVPDFRGVEPRLWESWKYSPDHKTLTVHLKKGIRSNFGNELTAKDALWTYQRWDALKAIGKFFLNTAIIPSAENVKLIDDYTFSITAERKNPMIMGVHFCGVHTGYHDSTEARKHATADDPWATKWLLQNNASFGPYSVSEWKPGDRIVLKSNPNYFKGEPPIKRVIRKVVPENFSRIAMIKAGTIDVAEDLTPKEIDSLQGAKGVKVVNIPGNMCLMLIMNQKFKPWDNKLVRKALSFAVPQNEIIKTAMYGYAKAMQSTGPSTYPASTPKEDFPYSYDPEKAKQLLKEAGYPNGFDCELSYNVLYPPDEVAATIVKTSLAKIGINVSLKKIPYGAFFTQLWAKEIPFGFYTIQGFVDDPFYEMHLMWRTNGLCNLYSYSNKEVDKLIEEGSAITDWNERKDAYKKIAKMVMDDAPVVWILERNYTIAIRDNIEGWNWTTWGGCYTSELNFK